MTDLHLNTKDGASASPADVVGMLEGSVATASGLLGLMSKETSFDQIKLQSYVQSFLAANLTFASAFEIAEALPLIAPPNTRLSQSDAERIQSLIQGLDRTYLMQTFLEMKSATEKFKKAGEFLEQEEYDKSASSLKGAVSEFRKGVKIYIKARKISWGMDL